MRATFLAILATALVASAANTASAQLMPKARVADLIVKVENGVDEFRNYLERRGENAKDAAGSGKAAGRRTRKPTEGQKAAANDKKDRLDDALGDINRSTNRLRRKFDATDTWMETKAQVQQVVDDGRKINQEVGRGNYGTEVARLWATLRAAINELARAYSITPLGV